MLWSTYKISIDNDGKKFCGLTIKWNYTMSRYTNRALSWFQHPKPKSLPIFATPCILVYTIKNRKVIVCNDIWRWLITCVTCISLPFTLFLFFFNHISNKNYDCYFIQWIFIIGTWKGPGIRTPSSWYWIHQKSSEVRRKFIYFVSSEVRRHSLLTSNEKRCTITMQNKSRKVHML